MTYIWIEYKSKSKVTIATQPTNNKKEEEQKQQKHEKKKEQNVETNFAPFQNHGQWSRRSHPQIELYKEKQTDYFSFFWAKSWRNLSK